MIIEHSLEIDSFNKPASYEGGMGLAKHLQNLIILKPGTYPSSPDMGFGMSNYKFQLIDNDLITDMKKKLEEQIDKFLPQLSGSPITILKIDNDILGIGIEIEGTAYMVRIENKDNDYLANLITLD